MCENWIGAYQKYDWKVDLRYFKERQMFPGSFDRIIRSTDVIDFEDEFRRAIADTGPFVTAGEVCYWKNYGSAKSRDRLTKELLAWLADRTRWKTFADAVIESSRRPSFQAFKQLRNACNQPKGFATPITFLSFYNPIKYPMVDKHIANWWGRNKAGFGFASSEIFHQRNDGWIQGNEQSWQAYLEWKSFCIQYVVRLAENCGLKWRARDVEMAVWEAQKNAIILTA
jgi:hypothetical protein